MQIPQPDFDALPASEGAYGAFQLGDRLEECDELACRIWGYPREAVLGKTLLDLSPASQADGTASREALAQRVRAARAGMSQSFEWRFQRGNGELVDCLLAIERARVRKGGSLQGRVRELAALDRVQAALRESEARLHQIIDNTTAVIYIKDREGRFLLANRQFERLFAVRQADLIGKHDGDVFSPDIAAAFQANDKRVMEEAVPVQVEEIATLPDGVHTYISVKFPLFNTRGEAYAVCGISTDITERKRTEQALRNVALGVSAATGGVFEAIVRYLAATLDVDFAFVGKLVEGSPGRLLTLAICHNGNISANMEYDLAGTPCQTVVGRRFQFIPQGLLARFPGDTMLKRFGFQSYAGYPLFDSNGTPLGLIAVTHRKPLTDRAVVESTLKIFSVRAAAELERVQAEEARLASEASYRAIFEAAEDAVFVHDIDTGAIVDVNPKACRAYGYNYDEMLRIGVADLSSGVPPYTLEEAGKFLEKAKRGEPQRFEWHRRNKDGSLHWDEVYLKRATIAGVDRIIAFTREITERKEREEERVRLEAQLRQAQKMEAIGHLSGGIAHDFNNILTGILGYLVLAQERSKPREDEKLTRYLERAHQSGQRARDLISQLLTFSRGQRGEPRPLSLAPVIAETVQLLSSTLPATVEFHTELDPHAPAVLLDPVQVDQVLMNLCINARDAMRGSGSIVVAVREARHDHAVCASCRQIARGRFVELSVRDTGTGIPGEYLDRIFEPFFTTKEKGKGSGMGLSVVHGIVHEYGGHILVDAIPGTGTEFRVLFQPLEAQGEGPINTSATSERKGRLHGRVLVVDDDDAAGEFVKDLFESWGLKVVLTRNGDEASDAFTADAQRFDLALLDQTMPRMTGLELAQHLLALRPELPVILYTGYSEGLSEERAKMAGVRALVRKPLDTDMLFQLASTLLLSIS